MAIEQQRVHVAGRRAGLANLEEIRLASILLPDCPWRWRMSELDLSLANPLHHGDESGTLAPVGYHKPKRNSDKIGELDKRATTAILHVFKWAANKAVKRQKKKPLIYCLSWNARRRRGKKNRSLIDKLHKEHGNVRDSESRSRYFVKWK